MKRIIALITMLAMLLSFTAVSADNRIDEKFLELMQTQVPSGSLDMTMTLSNNIPMLRLAGEDGMVVASLLSSSIDYDLNFISNEAGTIAKGDGRMMFNSGAAAYGIPSFGLDMWINADFANLDNIQFFMIMKGVGEIFAQEIDGDKYLLFDYTKIPGFKELIKELASLGLLDKSKLEQLAADIIDEQKLAEFVDRMLAGIEINPTYANGKYSIILGDAEVKQLYGALFTNLFTLIAELAGEEIPPEAFEELKAIGRQLAAVQIFDAQRGLVIEISDDARVMHSEINISTNLLDVAKAIDPQASADGIDPSMMAFEISMKADGRINDLPAGYEVQYPKLDRTNSIDLLGSEYGISLEMIEAAEVSDNVIEIIYNGEVIQLENKPMIINDRTFVPFRRLANMLGIDDENIGYDEATQKVYLKSGDIDIEMYIGSSVVYVNGEMKMLDVPAFTSNDRTYIPLRFISEMFGRTVGYTEENGVQRITIDD